MERHLSSRRPWGTGGAKLCPLLSRSERVSAWFRVVALKRGKDMDKGQHHMAKVQLMAQMQAGHSWQTAAAKAGLQISQSNAYRLWGAFRQHGETALSDGRHGHPIKLRGTARAFLEEQCRQAPQTPSSTIQVELRERLFCVI